MAFANMKRNLAFAVLAVAATAILVWFGNGLDPVWPLMWFAMLPVLLFAARSSWTGAFFTAFLACLLGSFNLWYYFRLLHVPVSAQAVVP